MNSFPPLSLLIRHCTTLLCCAAVVTLCGCEFPASPPPSEAAKETETKQVPLPDLSDVIVVAPDGVDTGEGTLESPLRTLSEAVKRVVPGKSVIALRGGTYVKGAQISGGGEDPLPITIRAYPGETVIFDGGEAVKRWEPEGRPGLYYLEDPGRGSYGRYGKGGYYEVWEDETRLRYRKVLDADGVAAWPGSICVMDERRLLVHVPRGRTPEEAMLWRGKTAEILSVSRSNVTLEGIIFRNAVGGGDARGLTITTARGVVVRNCQFHNCAAGISVTAHGTLIEDCTFRDVGLGIRFSGKGTEMVARRCLIESAQGTFAFSDMGEHERNGFRIYHAGDGARIEQCVTAGFWAGLYIKTISHREGSRPFYIENNTFLDGFRSGADHRQPRTFVRRNIIGANPEATGVAANGGYLRKMGATLEQNYFFGWGGKAEGSDVAGPEPFHAKAEGNLSLRHDIPLPEGVKDIGATGLQTVKWNPAIAASLAPAPEETRKLAMIGQPVVTASAKGALVVADFTVPLSGTLQWQGPGETVWRTVTGRENTVVRPAAMAAMAPVGPERHDRYSLIFPLMGLPLQPGASYRYKIELRSRDGKSLVIGESRFIPSKGEKTLHVAANAEEGGDGSGSKPFASLQDALNRALPGDTVLLGAGVWTRPVILHHGGTEDAPLVIRGQGPEKTILDGGKEVGTLVELRQAPHVHFHGMQVRWFGNLGIYALGSPNGRLENCRIINQALDAGFGRSGNGFHLKNSPGWVVTRSTFNTMEHGMLVVESPGFTAIRNTSYGNIYSGLALIESAKDSRILYNSFNFTGNDSLVIRERRRETFETLQLDYNNYGTILWKVAEIDRGGTVIKTEGRRPENDFTPPERYGKQGGSKFMMSAIINGEHHSFFRLGDWQKFTGKDQHSIFADPKFAHPLRGDFRLLPDTPNRLASGEIIGSGEIAQPAQASN